MSTMNQTQKGISISKKNSSIYNKKQSSSTSTKNHQKAINNYTNKIQNNNIIYNMEIGRKASLLLYGYYMRLLYV